MKDLRFFSQEDPGERGDLFVEPRCDCPTDRLWITTGRDRCSGLEHSPVLDLEQVIKLRDELTLWIAGRDERPAPPKKWTEES
jgi:hypothetical protein